MSNKKISTFVENQLPSHIRNNYETFTKFIIYYYEYMELEGNPVDMSFDYLKNVNLQEAEDDYLEVISKKFISNIPLNDIQSKKLLIQNIAKFYNAKGSEDSYTFIFNMLFGEAPSEYYLPKNDIIVLSSFNYLSSEKKLFDGVYYQNYSYTLKVSQTLFDAIKENKEHIIRLVHPIGKKIFLLNTDTQQIEAL